jgi:hypothetical protein
MRVTSLITVDKMIDNASGITAITVMAEVESAALSRLLST